MSRKKVTIRPPGLKPTTKVGTWGPHRARLGFAWVIAPVIVGALILVAGYLALTR
jgi:CBS-domain-containing membrane protein